MYRSIGHCLDARNYTFGFSRIGSTEMMFPQTTETQLLLTYARDGKHFSSLKAIYGQTGSGNMAAVYFLFHQIQCIGLSATVSTLQTTSGLVGTGSTEIRRWSIPNPKTVLDMSTSIRKVLPVYDSPFRPNRKWKYRGNRKNELAAMDFLFDPNTMYGCISHRFDARNYFRSRRNRKY